MNAFRYIQHLSHNTFTHPNLPFTDNLASPNGFVAQMLTLPLRKHRATGRLKRLRLRNRWFAGTGTTDSRLFVSQNGNVNILATERQSYHRC